MYTQFNFDVLTGLLWTITYIVIIVIGIKNKSMIMPIPALLLNFAWEITAIILHGHIIQWVWGGFDLIMFLIYLTWQNKSVNNKKKRLICLPVLMGLITILYFIFNSAKLGMLISCFAIDLLMAVIFILYQIRFPKVGYNLTVGILKLLGDLFAWLYYRGFHSSVNLIGICVLFLNVIYIVLCFNKVHRFVQAHLPHLAIIE